MRLLAFTLALSFLFTSSAQKEFIFWRNYEVINPATVGLTGKYFVSTSYGRNTISNVNDVALVGGRQWEKIGGAFAVSYEHDESEASLYKMSTVNFSYAYHLNFSGENILSFGVNVGRNQTTLNTSRLVFEDQISSLLGISGGETLDNIDQSQYRDNNLDFDFGVALKGNKSLFTLGIGRLNQPSFAVLNNGSSEILPAVFTVTAERDFGKDEDNWICTPRVLIRRTNGITYDNIAVEVKRWFFLFGAKYSTTANAVGAFAGIYLGEKVSLVYMADTHPTLANSISHFITFSGNIN